MILALRILFSIPVWLLRVALLLVLALLGIPVIWVLAQQAWCWPAQSRRFDRVVLHFPMIAALWDNDEDGVDGLRGGDPAQQWWADKTAGWSPQKRIFIWSAFRNPVDSLRWVPILNPQLVVRDVRFVGVDHEPAKGENGWYFAWMGFYSCIRVERWGWRIWLGWKLKPDDVKGLQPGDVRAIRCDFACQLKRVA